MATALSPAQQRLLDYLQQAVDDRGASPSLRQAAADLGISHTAVAQGLKALEAKGRVKRDGRYSRTVHLLDRDRMPAAVHRWRQVPVIGQITAGLPMYAQQQWDGTVVVDRDLFAGDHLFALRVKGDSMTGAAILDGDLAICRPRQYAENGEIVVALVQAEEATVKRFFHHPDRIELRPENPRYRPLFYSFDDVLIQGKVIGIQRGPTGVDAAGRRQAGTP